MKFSRKLIMKMRDTKCTSNDIDLVIYLTQFQLANGFIPDVYYKDILESMNFSTTTLYRSLKRLSDRGILTYDISERYGYFNIWLSESDYSDVLDFGKMKYVNVNQKILHSDDFKNLKASEKYTLLLIMCRDQSTRNEISATDTQIAIYAGIKMNKQVVSRIVNKLNNIIYESAYLLKVTYEQKKDHITYHFRVMNSPRFMRFERDTAQRHMLSKYLQKHKISYSDEELEDFLRLENEYFYCNKEFKKIAKSVIDQYRSLSGALVRHIIKPLAEKYMASFDQPKLYSFYNL